jgi:tetratricopeptide (TPR) repeat protein
MAPIRNTIIHYVFTGFGIIKPGLTQEFTMDAQEAQKIFEQAETERVTGSDTKAIELYMQLTKVANKYQLDARHMLGVMYRTTGQTEQSLSLLKEVLDTEELSPLKRAHILRDYGDALRVNEQYDQATAALEESLKLFETNGANPAERAATLGFLSRVAAQKGDLEAAFAKGTEAEKLFAQYDNRHTELYHAIYMARLLAKMGRSDEARKKAQQLKPVVERYGKDVHRERLEIIERLADDPDKLEAAIKNSRDPNMS